MAGFWAQGVELVLGLLQYHFMPEKVWNSLLTNFDEDLAMSVLVNNDRLDYLLTHLNVLNESKKQYGEAIGNLPSKHDAMPAAFRTSMSIGTVLSASLFVQARIASTCCVRTFHLYLVLGQ